MPFDLAGQRSLIRETPPQERVAFTGSPRFGVFSIPCGEFLRMDRAQTRSTMHNQEEQGAEIQPRPQVGKGPTNHASWQTFCSVWRGLSSRDPLRFPLASCVSGCCN